VHISEDELRGMGLPDGGHGTGRRVNGGVGESGLWARIHAVYNFGGISRCLIAADSPI